VSAQGREPFWIENSRCNYADASPGVSHCSKNCSRSLQSLSCQGHAPSHISALEISAAVLLLSGSRDLVEITHTSPLLTRAHPRALTLPVLTLPLLAPHTLPLLSRSAHLAADLRIRIRAGRRNAKPGDATPRRETQRRAASRNAEPGDATPCRESQRRARRRNAAPRVASP
jgi:hypothetical protein